MTVTASKGERCGSVLKKRKENQGVIVRGGKRKKKKEKERKRKKRKKKIIIIVIIKRKKKKKKRKKKEKRKKGKKEKERNICFGVGNACVGGQQHGGNSVISFLTSNVKWGIPVLRMGIRDLKNKTVKKVPMNQENPMEERQK